MWVDDDCVWPIEYAGLDQPDEQHRDVCERLAVEFLWNWTGHQYGLCDVTVRPCRDDCQSASGFTPALIRGQWFNLACGFCGVTCGCQFLHSIRLAGPVHEVTGVSIDGESVDDWVAHGDLVLRQAGWPVCQDVTAELGEPGTWSITYQRGVPVPKAGQVAAGALAAELCKALNNDRSCALPKRVQSITRQGVSMEFVDTFDDIEDGHTGIWVVDSWVASVMKAPVRPMVLSPDRRGTRFYGQ